MFENVETFDTFPYHAYCAVIQSHFFYLPYLSTKCPVSSICICLSLKGVFGLYFNIGVLGLIALDLSTDKLCDSDMQFDSGFGRRNQIKWQMCIAFHPSAQHSTGSSSWGHLGLVLIFDHIYYIPHSCY